MINFKLKNINEAEPAGSDGDLRMSWFWLTDGDLWLTLSDSTIYEYTPAAQKHFGDKNSTYNDYPIIRFIEDFTEIFKEVSESIPDNIYQVTQNLTEFLKNAQKWLDVKDLDDSKHSDFYFEVYDPLISWTYKRTFDSGHLIGGPRLSFFRNNEKIRIIWETEYQLDGEIDLWTAKNGNIEMSYNEFIMKVKDFGKRFFSQMKEQVDSAVEKDWKDIQIDKNRLIEEHREREKDFFDQLALLENNLSTETNWKLVQELKFKMEKEIETKAQQRK